MQTSRFQLGLIATLAVGLGFSLSSSEAVGYPAGAAVSLGANPVWSTGGTPSATQVVASPVGKDLIITDFVVGGNSGYQRVSFTLSDGTIVGGFGSNSSEATIVNFESGIRVPAGDTLTMTFASYHARTDFRYSVSGYYAQP
jgi:hypothetical protein